MKHSIFTGAPVIARGRIMIIAASCGIAVLTSPMPALGQVILKLGHVGNPGHVFQIVADEYAKRVNKKLNGEYKVVVYGSSQLGSDTEMLQKLKLGTLDMSIPSSVMSSQVDLFGIFEMPYIVQDRDHMYRIEKEIFWPSLAPAAEKKGLKILAVWENGFRDITNNIRPIVTPADLAGIKLRVPQGKWRVKMFETYGANPSPMGFAELFSALQTGVMDGQENPLVSTYSSKLQEVQKYLSLTRHLYTPAYLVMSTKRFAKLPEPIQRILADTAKDVQAFAYETGIKTETIALEELKKSGMQVNEVDKAAFIAASKPIYEEFGEEVPGAKALIDRAQELRH